MSIVSRLRAAGCVFAEDEAELLQSAAGSPDELESMIVRRVAGLPLEQVVGWAEFCGLRILLDPGVFVPRRRSEFLVRQAVELAGDRSGLTVVDLCCGSGALGAAVATPLGASLHACDIDPAAVACARRNVTDVHLGDLFDPLPAALRGRIDLLLANVPYVPTAEVPLLPAEAREHEAFVALDGGPDGLDVLRRVLADARSWLAPGGHLLVETSTRQADTAAKLMTDHGLTPRVESSEEFLSTVVIGSR
ncbi:putative protein N(5)-glutamine methyltransferase [Nonomuraea soli]|uniref:peptide chain release factor N(5)-glutamine methyltransferase n=1 Tax=Nonomuraea soli TaxID=1032476 RepID=A0A7W0CQF8_9ACTN|nr:putative protein N(5)-glutamine methyltransferase [Nonomuraea soli]MBA2895308.1 release factor glutamine methyltransferase [Nonomuraea soli]